MGNRNSLNKKLDFSEGTEAQENNETCLISPEKLKYLDFLGQGSFGIVFRAKWEKSNGQVIECAVKTLRDISTYAEVDALQEIRNMEMLSDANVVKLYGIAVRPHIQVVVEFCDGGALVHRLRDKNKPFLLVTQLLDYSKQLSSGMMYLESQRCVHRDLAARNVLLTNREKLVKISDFGLTRFLSMDELYYKTHNSAIPYPWCPPEAIRDKKFCHKSDVWAFGVTMWEMFTYGSSPWANVDANDVISSIESGIRLAKPISAFSELYDIMLSCWEIQKHRRPPFEAIHRMLKHMSFTVGKCYKNHWFADDSDKLNINKRERVIIIDDSDPTFWIGQNVKTGKIGSFDKNCIVNSPKNVSDAESLSTSPISPSFMSQLSFRRTSSKSSNGEYEMPKVNEMVKIEAMAIGKANLVIQMDGCNIVMYPRSNHLAKLMNYEKIDLCIGHPTDDVIQNLIEGFPQILWVIWHKEKVEALQKHNIERNCIYLTKRWQKQELQIDRKRFKVYNISQGYAILSSSHLIYLSPVNLPEESKTLIKKLRPFEVAFFLIHSLKHEDEVKNVHSLIKPQRTIIMFAKSFTLEEKEKFLSNLTSKPGPSSLMDDFIVIEEGQGYRHNVAKAKDTSLFGRFTRSRSRRSTNTVCNKIITAPQKSEFGYF